MAIHLSPKAIALASLGTVGAGGVGAVGIAYSKGLVGSGVAKPKKIVDYPSLHELLSDDGDKVYLDQPSSTFQRDGAFNVEPYRCAEAFFPGVQLPNMKAAPETITAAPGVSTLLIEAPSGLQRNESEGCSIMLIQRKEKRFILKIELALRNGEHGLLLGRAFKNAATDDTFRVQHFQYAAFLRKTGDQWNVQSALSWGTKTEDELLSVDKMIIALPDNNTALISDSQQTSENNHFVGVWSGKGGSSVPFAQMKDRHLDKSTSSNSLSMNVTCLERPKDNIDTFFSGANSPKWQRFSGGITGLSSGDVAEHMEKWIKALTADSSGQWTPVESHCRESGEGHGGEICRLLKEGS